MSGLVPLRIAGYVPGEFVSAFGATTNVLAGAAADKMPKMTINFVAVMTKPFAPSYILALLRPASPVMVDESEARYGANPHQFACSTAGIGAT